MSTDPINTDTPSVMPPELLLLTTRLLSPFICISVHETACLGEPSFKSSLFGCQNFTSLAFSSVLTKMSVWWGGKATALSYLNFHNSDIGGKPSSKPLSNSLLAVFRA